MSVQGRYAVPAEYGERVRFVADHGDSEGEGVFTLCWLGIEEVWDVQLDNGKTMHLYPCFGDTMAPLPTVDESAEAEAHSAQDRGGDVAR